MSVVDFHLHLFSRPYFEALAAFSPLPGSVDERLARVVEKAKLELPPPDLAAHVARWIAEFDRHGVEHVAAFASAPEATPALAEAAVLSKGRITPFALVNPKAEGVAARVRTLLETKGFRGVLLFPALHHYELGAPECRELLGVLDEQRAIAYVHCGLLVVKLRDLLGIPRTMDPRFANPLNVIPAAHAFPNVRFVIPHFGAGFFRETLLAGAQCPNVFVDTSSTNSWIATQPTELTLRDVFERALGVFGPERILFGTDSNTFPAGWRADRLAEQRAIVDALAPSFSSAIFGANARRLLTR
ncbi:MAG: amidohydrolase [Planctomycetaceae bacterium]|nr:amidohydrolase [Planctomycetaceae bacterium]